MLFCAVLLVYVLPWATGFLPSSVRWAETMVITSRGNNTRRMRYAQVASFSWEQREGYRVLTLVPRRGGPAWRIGVPAEISGETIHMSLIRQDALPLPPARVGSGGAFAPRALRV